MTRSTFGAIIAVATLAASAGFTTDAAFAAATPATAGGGCVAPPEQVLAPTIDGESVILGDVDGVASDDLWAVGSYGSLTERHTIIEHWDGSSWSIVPSPDGVKPVNWLTGVMAFATDDVWAVGYSSLDTSSTGRSTTLVLHWDGAAWTVRRSPNPDPPLPGGSPTSNEVFGIGASSPTDLWLVGHSYNVADERPFSLHWDGTGWTEFAVPHPGTASRLSGVTVLGPNDAWAVGYQLKAGLQVNFTVHWDGTRWTQAPTPNVGPFVNELLKVEAVAPDDVWAVGDNLAVFGVSQVLQTSVIHWDGTAWSVVPSPNWNQQTNRLFDLTVIAEDDIWAVGLWDTTTALRALLMHWDGAEWSLVPDPIPPGAGLVETFGAGSTPDGAVWTVGDFVDNFIAGEPLTIRLVGECPAMHVASVRPKLRSASEQINTVVGVVDANNAPIQGATVTVEVDPPVGATFTATAVTNAVGKAAVAVSSANPGTYTFTVTDVFRVGATYDPAANTETSDSITVP